MTPTKPSAGALRAAEAFMRWNGEQTVPKYMLEARDRLALIIDSESGLAELLKAASWLVDCAADLGADDIQLRECRTAIAKATNPNTETVQAFPKGRWAEKGTV